MARLICNITEWMGWDHGEVNYYLTQFFASHGYFNAYLAKMHKVDGPAYAYQDSPQDDAFHAFFKCEVWNEDIAELERKV